MKHLPIYNPQLESHCKEFKKMVVTKGYKSADTLANHIQEFLFFIETIHLEQISYVKAKHIIAYYEYLNERPNQRRGGTLSDSAVNIHLFALRLFFDYLLDTNQIQSSPARIPKFTRAPYVERNAATIEEIKLIYNQTTSKFERALLALAYGCGLRRMEITKLNISDIDFQNGMLTVRSGKNGKTRAVPLSNNVLKDLKEYLVSQRSKQINCEQNKLPAAFLLDDKGERIKADRLNERIKKLVKATNNQLLIKKNITLHCLRHSIATHLLDKGASIEFVQSFLGHQLLDTTHIYSKKRKQKRMLGEAFYRHQLTSNNKAA
jgi:site-specific recombinase XerD